MSEAELPVVAERDFAHTPAKVWRALTEPQMIEGWLMKNDFKPVPDHPFSFRADWGSVDCRVVTVEPNKVLAYTWEAHGLKSVVTFTLTATGARTHLRVVQSGFRPDQKHFYDGAKAGWPGFIGAMGKVLDQAA